MRIEIKYLLIFILLLTSCDKLGFKPPQISFITTNLIFDGLQEDEIKISINRKSIIFDFGPATNANGEVSYEIYEGRERENFLVRTKQTYWEYSVPNPEKSQAFVFSARAFDKDGGDLNQEFVIINYSDPDDHIPPEFDGVKWAWKASHDKILLKWEHSKSEDLSKYYIYSSDAYSLDDSSEPVVDIKNAVGSTARNYFMVKGLHMSSRYAFIVRAVDASGNEDKNTKKIISVTHTDLKPNFDGVVSVDNVAGKAGLSKLNVKWIPSSDSDVTGYLVFKTKVYNDDQLFEYLFGKVNDAIAVLGKDTNSFLVENLDPNTQYFFNVRAFKQSGTQMTYETNRIVVSKKTLEVKAPTFAGVEKVMPGEGSEAFSKIHIEWSAPLTDGVWDGFFIRYENFEVSGDCNSAFSPNAPKFYVENPSALSQELVNDGTNVIIEKSKNYKIKVNTAYRLSDGTFIEDSNSKCLAVRTEPQPPQFEGITSLSLADGEQGFDTVEVGWNKASGSFTHYIIEAATDAAFTNIVRKASGLESLWFSSIDESAGSITCEQSSDGTYRCTATRYETNLLQKDRTSYTLSKLPTNVRLYVRVRAEYNEFIGGEQVIFEALNAKDKKLDIVTLPEAPLGEALVLLEATSPSSVNVYWTPPTNSKALYNMYKIWHACGEGAFETVSSKNGTLTVENDITKTIKEVGGLTSDVNCCFLIRAHFENINRSLSSKSTSSPQCITPTLMPPEFAGIASAVNPNDESGFNSILVSWPGRASGDRTNFSYWQVSWSIDNGITMPYWGSTNTSPQLTDETKSSYTISQDILPNKTYYFKVRAAHEGGGNVKYAGQEPYKTAKTTPQSPSTTNLPFSVESGGATSIKVTFTAPPASSSTTGLWDSVLVYVTTQDLNYFVSSNTDPNTVNELYPISINSTVSVDAITHTAIADFSGALGGGKIIRVINVLPNQENILRITGLEQSNILHYVRLSFVYYGVGGDKERFIESDTKIGSAEPYAQPPEFSGIKSIVKYNNDYDFSKIKVTFDEPVGDCTKIEISVTKSANLDETSFTSNPANIIGTCTGITEKEITKDSSNFDLVPHDTYYIRIQAVFEPMPGTRFASGKYAVQSTILRPNKTTSDKITNAVATAIPNSFDKIDVTWTNPQEEPWNKIFIFYAEGASQLEAQNAVKAAALTKADNTGPVNESLAIAVNRADATGTYTFNTIKTGPYYCFLVKAAYDRRSINSKYYVASEIEETKCTQIPYHAPNFAGIQSADVDGTCPDGTARYKLTLNYYDNEGDDSIDEWWIYYSKDSSLNSFGDFSNPVNKPEPWQKVTVGDSYFDADDPNSILPPKQDSLIYAGCQGRTISGGGYFHVRYHFIGDSDPVSHADTNQSVAALTSEVPGSQANFVYVSGSKVGLAYDFLLMAYEASLIDGTSFNSLDSVKFTEMSSCNQKFHDGTNVLAPECIGTFSSTAKVQSLGNKTPAVGTWHNAWYACRNSSDSLLRMRLPTEEEWRRTARFLNYSKLTSNDCNFSGVISNTKPSSTCISHVGAYDMAGNVSEWVDNIMVQHNLVNYARFNYGPTIGRNIESNINNVFLSYHKILPPAPNYLALLMGSNFLTGTTYTQDSEVERWVDPKNIGTGERGFRCVAFLKNMRPANSQLTLPKEPEYSASDNPDPLTSILPENKFITDIKPESVTIDTTPDYGKIILKWSHYSTPTCDGNRMKYHIYRFVEPSKMDIKYTIPWALEDSVDYTSNVPLDPITMGDGIKTGPSDFDDKYLIATVNGIDCTLTGFYNCQFEDKEEYPGTLHRQKLYMYLIVAEDNQGNRQAARVQKFRSPYFTGELSDTAEVAFRTEYRFRRASIFVVDDSFWNTFGGAKQYMAYVPLDKSGLDHDFYIQKYEASAHSGGAGGQLAQANTPKAVDSYLNASNEWVSDTGAWVPDAAKCYADVLKGGAHTSNPLCTNSTTLETTSRPNVTPVARMYFGDMWRACANSELIDENGTSYYMYLPSGAEWVKAADWGDVNFDNTIDQNPFVSGQVSLIEYNTSDPEACNFSGSLHNSGQSPKCVSRYGVYDMVGNYADIANERSWITYNSAYLIDNGLDALSFNGVYNNSLSYSGTIHLDLLKGLLVNSTDVSWVVNGYGVPQEMLYDTNTGFVIWYHGGYSTLQILKGRFSKGGKFLKGTTEAGISFRCVR